MNTTLPKHRKFAVITTVVAAMATFSAPALADTDGGLLTRASEQAGQQSYDGMVTDGMLLTRASKQQDAQVVLATSYAGMVTDGGLLTAAAQQAEPLSR
jgi:uncharacterized protein YdeI (BOF family)